MAIKTYRAQANLIGLRAGQTADIDEKEAEPYVAAGLLVLEPSRPRKAAAAETAAGQAPAKASKEE